MSYRKSFPRHPLYVLHNLWTTFAIKNKRPALKDLTFLINYQSGRHEMKFCIFTAFNMRFRKFKSWQRCLSVSTCSFLKCFQANFIKLLVKACVKLVEMAFVPQVGSQQQQKNSFSQHLIWDSENSITFQIVGKPISKLACIWLLKIVSLREHL